VPVPAQKGGLVELVAPPYLPRTIVLAFTWIFQTLAVYGFASWVPTLLAEHGFRL
jgi:putative MFS transporter